MSKKMKTVVYEKLEIEVRDHEPKIKTIAITDDINEVMTVIIELFNEVLGDKFTSRHANALIAEQSKRIEVMLKTGLQSGMLVMHRVEFDDNTDVLMTVKVNKE